MTEEEKKESVEVVKEEKKVTAICWACKRELAVPLTPSGEPYFLFQCGNCFAYNELGNLNDPNVGCVPVSKQEQVKKKIQKFGNKVFWFANGLLCVPFVTTCFMYEIIAGIYFVLPLVYEPWSDESLLAHFFALFLGFHTVVNYYFCLNAKAPVPPDSADPIDIDNKALTGYRFCKKCNKVKPPRSHHCSTCQVCVPVLDHHCIFTGKCIGSHNHRYFLLFLFWLILSTAYILLMCVFAVQNSRTLQDYGKLVLVSSFSRFSVSIANMRITRTKFDSNEAILAIVVLFEVSLAIGAILGVGFLFYLQLKQIRKGLTQFEASFEQPIHGEKVHYGLITNLKTILGPNILLWPWTSFPSQQKQEQKQDQEQKQEKKQEQKQEQQKQKQEQKQEQKERDDKKKK